MNAQFPTLMSPFTIGNIEVRNRLVDPAHATALSADHRPTPRLAAFHAARARGGVGLIILENSRVHPTSAGGGSSMEAWNTDNIPYYKTVADAVHPHGAKILAQLIHMGRNANSMDTLMPVWAPSANTIPWANPSGSNEVPHEISKDEIKELIQWWVKSAMNLKLAGLDGVEIHGAHGFLVGQFLSPLTNQRTDEYGGSQKNRTRFALELAHAIRQEVGRDFVVGIRLSADELIPGGITLEHSIETAQLLEEAGDLDFLNISHSVEYAPFSLAQQIADMSWPQAAYIHLAEAIKKATKGIPIFGVCRIVDPEVAENITASGKADMVCMARAHLADPEIGRKLMEGRRDDIRPCTGSNQSCASRTLGGGRSIGCLVNPEAGREFELGQLTPAETKRAVVIIGGGPGGMEAARVAAVRGHQVALYEKSDSLGGQVNTLVKAPLRRDFGRATDWLEAQIRKLGVDVHLNTEVTADSLPADTNVVIVATGSEAAVMEISDANGSGGPKVVTVDDVLDERVIVEQGQKVVLVDDDGTYKAGGTTEFLADKGAEVHYVTGSGGVAKGVHAISQVPLMRRLQQKNVLFHVERWVKHVEDNTILLSEAYGEDAEAIQGVDLIVTAGPNSPVTQLYETLKNSAGSMEVIAVGDCVTPRSSVEAIREGYMAARAL